MKKLTRIGTLVIIGGLLSTGTINADIPEGLPKQVKIIKGYHNMYTTDQVVNLSGIALKKLYDYDNTFLVYNYENWNGEEVPIKFATHAIIPLNEYCSPNYESYKAIKLGTIEVMDEDGNIAKIPLYEEVNIGTNRTKRTMNDL